MKLRKTVVAVVLALGVTSSGAAPSPADTPSNPNILTAIQSLRNELAGAFTSLFQQLQNIQTALQGLIPAVSNVLFTPPLVYPSGAVDRQIVCTVVNLAADFRQVDIQIIGSGGVIASGGLNVAPNTASTFSFIALTSGQFVCKFTLGNGTKNDVSLSATQILGNQIIQTVGVQ
jgi:hypothetical protein